METSPPVRTAALRPDSLTLNPPPPAYDSIHVDRRISLSTSHTPTQTAPAPQAPGPSLLPLLTIPTKRYPLSSGFPYHPAVFGLGIPPDTWARFSDEIVQATKLSLTQQSLAWTSGISVGLVSVAAVPPFGAAAGVFAGKAVYDKTVLNNVKNGLEQGKLGEVLKRWNEDCWREKGVRAKLVVKQNKQAPRKKGTTSGTEGEKKKDKKKDQRQGAGRFELVLESASAVTINTNSINTVTSVTNSIEIEGLHTNTVPFELDDDSHPPELPPRPSELHMPTPELANGKAAVADKTRFSWASAHPLEYGNSSGDDSTDENITREAADEIAIQDQAETDGEDGSMEEDQRPVSVVSRSSDAAQESLSRDVEISPIEPAGRRSWDHIYTPMDKTLAPAPLFAR